MAHGCLFTAATSLAPSCRSVCQGPAQTRLQARASSGSRLRPPQVPSLGLFRFQAWVLYPVQSFGKLKPPPVPVSAPSGPERPPIPSFQA
eukprot:14378486-Alexandrium_andersonii.AAC.1